MRTVQYILSLLLLSEHCWYQGGSDRGGVIFSPAPGSATQWRLILQYNTFSFLCWNLSLIGPRTCSTASLPGSLSMSWSCSQWQSSICQPSNNRMCYDCFALNLWRSLLVCAWFWRLFGNPTNHKCKSILAAGSPVLANVISSIIDTWTPSRHD